MVLDGQEKVFGEYRAIKNHNLANFRAIFELKYQSDHRMRFEVGTSEWALYSLSLRVTRDQQNDSKVKCKYYRVISNCGHQPFDFYKVNNREYEKFVTLSYPYSERLNSKVMEKIVTNFWIDELKLLTKEEVEQCGYGSKKRFHKPEDEIEFSRIHRLYLPRNCYFMDIDYLVVQLRT